jgi:acyl-CoA thioesterase-1
MSTFPHRFYASSMKPLLSIGFFLFTLIMPSVAGAQSADVSLTVTPATVAIGQEIRVSYNIATSSFRTSDDIIMVNAQTRRLVTSQNIGTAKTGQKTFTTRIPGTYYFQYRANLSRFPIFATSSNVVVALPNPSLYTLTPSATTLNSGEPLVVTYNAPVYAFASGDDISVIDVATDRQVATQSVGTSPSGTKTFIIRNPGTYRVEYKVSITGSPVIKSTGPITVRIPDASLYTLSVAATTLNSGEPLVVTFSAPAYASQSGDDIRIIDVATGRQVATQSVGTSPSGTKTFIIRNPGAYRVEYKLAFAGTPVIRTAGPVTVRLPDPSLYTLSPSSTTLNSGEPLIITYASPAYAHQPGDDIVIIDTTTNRQIATQSVGTSPSGTKTFIIRNPGTYRVEYKSALTGSPVIKSVGPIVVRLPEASLFTLSTDITIAESNQPITVSFSAPTYAHQSGDDILVIDTVTRRLLDSVSVGSSPSGTKIFRIEKPGSYAFAYRMNISGLPVIRETSPITVTYVNLSRVANYPLRSGPIIAFGDSITYGRDAIIGQDYVSVLSGRLSETIVNAGVSGDTTTEALSRLDRDVLSKDPRLVIVFLGGNDFLQKVPTDTIFNNLDMIIDRITADGAAVLVLGYKDYFLVDYDSRYRTLAWDARSAYAPDVMGGILGNPFYTTDLIHPRSSGHKIIADRVEPYIRTLIGR